VALALFIVLAAAALPPDAPYDVQIIKESDHYVLRTLDGAKPLYTYDRDEPGKSNCIDACAEAWPPLRVGTNSKPAPGWTVIVRPDGVRQWAYKDKPVYTFARDAESIASGDGMGGVWHLLPATPAG
jgi:predicted lipoprotein with Yx(FWY)xxD motif